MDALTRLRSYLAEEIPAGGSDADTFFTDAALQDILQMTGGGTNDSQIYLAAAEGWERKAAAYTDLVTQQTGGSNRMLSDLHGHATTQADRFRGLAAGQRQTRVGKIVRRGTTVR